MKYRIIKKYDPYTDDFQFDPHAGTGLSYKSLGICYTLENAKRLIDEDIGYQKNKIKGNTIKDETIEYPKGQHDSKD